MARNTGDGMRKGAVKHRSQVFNPVTGHYIKRDTTTGLFIDTKTDGKPFKGIVKEKAKVATAHYIDYDTAVKIEQVVIAVRNMRAMKKMAK
jgi:hypothetical protein